MIPDELNDSELLKMALDGEERAFTALYRRWQKGIFRFAQRMSGSAAIAEDVTQEVFLSLIKGGSGFNPELGPFSPYIYGIARNHLLRRMARERKFAPILEEEDTQACWNAQFVPSDPLGDLTRQEKIDSLHRAVAALPLRYREVIVLCELQELSYAEAAGVIGCPEGTVRSRLHRARSLLLDKLRAKAEGNAGAPNVEAARCLL